MQPTHSKLHALPQSHITDAHRTMFRSLQSGDPCWRMFSCFCDGKPAVALCLVQPMRTDDGRVDVIPQFVAVTDGMELVDHFGRESADLDDIESLQEV